MDFYKAEQTRRDLFFVWIVTKMLLSWPLLKIWSVRLYFEIRRAASHLTACLLESNRAVARTNGDQHLVTLFTHVEQSQAFACASIAPVPFELRRKVRNEQITLGTDFTQPRHSSCQLSLIEILKCNALLAAATETILGKFCRKQTEDEDNRENSPFDFTVGILLHTIINVILYTSYDSFCSARYLRLHDKKLALSSFTSVCILQSRKRSRLLECALLAKRD